MSIFFVLGVDIFILHVPYQNSLVQFVYLVSCILKYDFFAHKKASEKSADFSEAPSYNVISASLIQIIPQALGAAGMPQLTQGFGFDLPHPLPGHVELPAQLFQRTGTPVLQPEAQGDHPLFPGRQALEHVHQFPAQHPLPHPG